MSDLFTDLASEGIGQAPAIVPRLASRFEGAVASPLVEMEEMVSLAPAVQSAPQAPRPAPVPFSVEESAEPRPAAEPRAQTDTIIRREETTRVLHGSQTVLRTEIEEILAPAPPPFAPERPAALPPGHMLFSESLEGQGVAERAPQTALEGTAPRPADPFAPLQVPSRPMVSEIIREAAPSPLRVETQPARETAAPALPRALEPPAPIQVTIGRVEIKAVTPPAAPPRAAPAQRSTGPALSLADYLAQRDRSG